MKKMLCEGQTRADDKPAENTDRDDSIRRRADYIKPHLLRYGDVAKLTAGSTGRPSDHSTRRGGED